MTDKQGRISGDLHIQNKQFSVNLSLISFEEDGSEIVYCPALDVVGYGKDETEAMNSFVLSLEEFFRYTTHKKTFITELKKLGWIVKKSHIKPMIPPPMSDLLTSNENFSRIFNNHAFRKFDKSIAMPIC